MEVGEYGDFLPVYIKGIRAETYNAVLARLYTFRGRQLMRPNYGSFVYLDVDRVDLLSLMYVRQSSARRTGRFGKYND